MQEPQNPNVTINNELFVPSDYMYNHVANNIQNESQIPGKELNMSDYLKICDPKTVDINVFNDYAEKLKQQPVQPQQTKEVNMVNTTTNDDLLFNSLANYRSLSETDLRNLLGSNFNYILEQIFNNSEGNKYRGYVHIFTDLRVIHIMNEIVYSAQMLPERIKIFCNKLVYDYTKYATSIDNSNEKEAVLSAMGTFASLVNRDLIPRLKEFGIDEKDAELLVMMSRSSLDPLINVKRVNHVIIGLPPAILNESLITAIFYTLFRSASTILEGVMLDVQIVSELPEGKQIGYALINLAVLKILNNLSDADMEKTLFIYSEDKQFRFPDRPVRFNMRSFSPNDYPRLDYIIQMCDIKNGKPLNL